MNGWCQVFVLLVCAPVGYGEFSPFIRAKLDCHFCLADHDADGVLTEADYALSVGNAYPRCLSTPEEAKDIANQGWKSFPGQPMNKTQYLGAVAQLMNTTDLYKAIEVLTSIMWKLWVCKTANFPDKKMEAAHFAGQFHDLGSGGDVFEHGDAAANGLDQDNDRLVSEAEYIEGAKGYFTFEDQSGGSKFFFGNCYKLDFTNNDYACHPPA